MTRSLYIIGEAGSGKTTLMHKYTSAFTTSPAIRLHNQLWAEPITSEQESGFRLGKVRHSFSGTDALGMSVNPDAVHWVEEYELPDFICGEGQRLSNVKFLTALHLKSSLTVIRLINANAVSLRQQRANRLNVREQSPAYVKATATKAVNLHKALTDIGIRVVSCDVTGLQVDDAVEVLMKSVDV